LEDRAVVHSPPVVKAILLYVAAVAVAATAAGQPIVTVEFSLSNPGARSMGFGGAFVALADDATAAFANPAGLVQLVRPEVSLEGRYWSYSTPYTQGGRVTGAPSGIGIDNVAGLRTEVSSYDTSGLSFVSFVYPTGTWAFALYRHQLADFEFAGQIQGLFADGPGPAGVLRVIDMQLRNRLEIVTHGASVSFALTEAFSVGIGLSFYDGSLSSIADRYFPDDNTVESYFALNSYLPHRREETHTTILDDRDIAFNGGVLLHVSDTWSVGAFFRKAPKFEFQAVDYAGPASGQPPGTVLQSQSAWLGLPDTFGAGVSYRAPDGRLTLSFE
jgi:long-subunit fatty acid transport protein